MGVVELNEVQNNSLYNARCIHVAMRGDSDIVSSWKTKTCGGDCLRSDLLPILDDR